MPTPTSLGFVFRKFKSARVRSTSHVRDENRIWKTEKCKDGHPITWEDRVSNECTHGHMHFCLVLSELYRPSWRSLWRGLFIKKKCLNLTYFQFMEIFSPISSTVMQIFHTKGQLSIGNYRAQAKRHSTGNKLCYNQVFQVYMALRLWVMKWVKRKQSTIVLSSPPPPNPKQTLPPIFHSLWPAPGKTDQGVIREGRQCRKQTSISSRDGPFHSQITYVIMKLRQGSSPNKP